MNPENNGFDNNFDNGFNGDVKPYRASQNLNVLLSNPQYQSGNTVGNNMTNESVNNTMGATTYQMPQINEMPTLDPQPVNIPVQNTQTTNATVSEQKLDVTEKNYQQAPIEDMRTIKKTTYVSNVAPVKEKKKKTLKVSKDNAIIIVMLLIIFVFIMILPALSEWIREIRY